MCSAAELLLVLFRYVGFGLKLVLPVPGWQKKSVCSIWPVWSKWEEQTIATPFLCAGKFLSLCTGKLLECSGGVT